MGIPAGVRYRASAVDLCDVRDTCGACRADREASVIALAHGESAAPLFLFRQQAREAAAETAADGLPDVARVLSRLARCPACGERDDALVRARRGGHIFRWLRVGFPVALLAMGLEGAALVFGLQIKPPVEAFLALAALNLAVVVWLGTRRDLARDRASADLRVEWTRVRDNGDKKWRRLGSPKRGDR